MQYFLLLGVRMRVLVAATHQTIVGGVETYLRAVVPRLRECGLDVGIVTAFPPTAGQPSILDGCPELRQWVVQSSEEVVAAANAFQPDVVYSHGLPDPRMDAELATRFPTLLYVHDYSGACVSGTKCFASPGWDVCSRRLGPACLALYWPRRCGGINPATALRLYRKNRRRQKLLPQYGGILVASQHMAAEVIRNGASIDQVAVVPLFPAGAEPDPVPPPSRPPTSRVLFVGRMTALKGCRELVTMIQRASVVLGRELTLVVVGDGPERPTVEAEARKQGLVVEFRGWCQREQILVEMRAADLLLVPSLWPEPFGLVGIEAGCVGLPSVAYPVGGIPEWLLPGINGELAATEDMSASALATAICRALGDTAHWQRLRTGAWEQSLRWTAAAHVAKLTGILAEGSQRKSSTDFPIVPANVTQLQYPQIVS